MGAVSAGFSHYRFDNKIYQKGSGRLFLVCEQQCEQQPHQKLEELGPLSLTHQAYLTFIINKDGQIATFDELAQLEGKHVNNNTVSKHIGKIKQRLGCAIENVPRQGYKLDSAPLMIDIKDFEARPSTPSVHSMPTSVSEHLVTANTLTLSPVFIVSVILFLLSLSIWFVNPVAQGQGIIAHNISKQQHSLLSPDGRLQAFEQKNRHQRLSNLWINNFVTGEKLALTAAKTGVEDKLIGFSKDGLTLLFSRAVRTKNHDSCSINKIVFTQFNPIKYSEKRLSQCRNAIK